MDSEKTNISREVTDAIKDQADSFIDDVKEELIEAKESFIEEVKNTILGLGNSVFGDLGLFLSIIRTIGIWFIRPTSLNVREIERQNIVRLGEGKKIRYFTDFNLMKSIFMLSLTFLVVEEAVAHASQDHWIEQAVFFIFFLGHLIKYYQLQKWRKVVGWILGFAFMAFLVFFPQIITEVFLTEK